MNVVDKNILITGGAGFIGSHLTQALLNNGNQVIVLDNLSSGIFENLPTHLGLKFVKGDILDVALVDRLMKHIDLVFHLAEYIPNTSGHVVEYSMNNPLKDLEISVKGTINVLEAARKTKAKVVLTSTAAVYGEPIESPVEEECATNPISPYGASKLAAEVYCNMYYNTHELPIVVARLFNVYGPRQRKYVMYDILSKLKSNPKKLEILGTGEQKRDFIYVGDVVNGLIYLSTLEEAYGQTFNMGTGISTSIKQIVKYITELLNVDPNVTYTGSSWKGDIKRLTADTAKLVRTGFSLKFELAQGLEGLVFWFQQAKKSKSLSVRQNVPS